MKANLYKCFLPVAWMIGRSSGVTGFLHPEGVYDDPKGGNLRRSIYQRLRGHYQFWNALFLFPEVHDQTKFSINIYGGTREPSFDTIANLYNPPTVDACYAHDGTGPVPGIKNDEGNWDLSGHADRVVTIDLDELSKFATLYDEADTPALEARLPSVHSKQILRVLSKFASAPQTLGDIADWYSTQHWNETNAQNEGTIKRETRFAKSADEWILSGPHFFVGNPFYKTPNEGCSHNQDYSVLDLTTLPSDYLPRTNYVPACSPEEYRARTPRVPWGDRKPVTDFYRIALRAMIPPSGERTLTPVIVAPRIAHTNSVRSICFETNDSLLHTAQFFLSVVADFYIKTTGKPNLHQLWEALPLVESTPDALSRVLGLVCLSTHFADIWDSTSREFDYLTWTKSDSRLLEEWFQEAAGPWTPSSPLRTDYSRRQALVELDVLAARALGLGVSDLQTLYRVQFPVLRQYEQDTWYDRNGRIVFTNHRGLTGVGLPRKANAMDATYGIRSPQRTESGMALGWEDIRHLKEGVVTKTFMDDTLPGGPVDRTVEYHAPFDRCDREEDYAVAWEHFEKRLAAG